jgi:hypothetical protein
MGRAASYSQNITHNSPVSINSHGLPLTMWWNMMIHVGSDNSQVPTEHPAERKLGLMKQIPVYALWLRLSWLFYIPDLLYHTSLVNIFCRQSASAPLIPKSRTERFGVAVMLSGETWFESQPSYHAWGFSLVSSVSELFLGSPQYVIKLTGQWLGMHNSFVSYPFRLHSHSSYIMVFHAT